MKLKWLIIKQSKIYSSEFEWVIETYVDFMNDFTDLDYAHSLIISSNINVVQSLFFCS